MTTSILSPLAYNLHENDFQTLRDFALDAPLDWQRFLLELAKRAEGSAEELAEALDDAVKEKDEAEKERDETIDENQRLKDDLETTQKALKKAQEEIERWVKAPRKKKSP